MLGGGGGGGGGGEGFDIPGETTSNEDVPLVEFMYLVFTCMPGESYCRQLRSFLL